MATITNLAVKIGLDAAGFIRSTQLVFAATGKMVNVVQSAHGMLKDAAAGYDKLNASAGGYLKTLFGIAGTGAMVAASIRAASAAEQAQKAGGTKSVTVEDPTSTLAGGHDRLTTAVTKAYEAFGTAFARSADLNKAMELLRGAVQSVTGVLSTMGSVAGAVFGWLVNTPPLFMALAVALKVVAVAAVFLAQVLITRLIVGMVTYLLLGTAMTPMALTMAAGKLIWAAATLVASGAVTVLTGAMALLIAVGFPVWAAIAVIVLVLAAAIAAVVAITYGLIKAFEWFTGKDPTADRIANMEAFAKATEDARKKVDDMAAALQKSVDQHGMSDQAKQTATFVEALNELLVVAAANGQDISDGLNEQLAAYMALQEIKAKQNADDEKREELLKREKTLQSELSSIVDEILDAGTSDLDQRLEKLKKMGATGSQLDWAQQALTMADETNRAAENRRTIEQDITNLQKEASQAGMTDAEKRLDNLKRLGATAAQIAAAEGAQAVIAAAEAKKKQAELGKAMKEATLSPMEQYQKKMAEIQKLLAGGNIDPITAMRAADAAQKNLESGLATKGIADVKSPQALLKGSAEAQLAENRGRDPIETLNETQKKALEEAKKIRAALEAAARNAPPQAPPQPVNF